MRQNLVWHWFHVVVPLLFHLWAMSATSGETLPKLTIKARAETFHVNSTQFTCSKQFTSNCAFHGDDVIILDFRELNHFNSNPNQGQSQFRSVQFHCEAPYDIKWVSNIPILSPEQSKLITKEGDERGRFLDADFKGGKNKIEIDTEIAFDSDTSGFISCQNLENSAINTTLYIFTNAGPPFVNFIDNGPHKSLIVNSPTAHTHPFVIPCRSNYANLSPSLYYKYLYLHENKLSDGGDSGESISMKEVKDEGEGLEYDPRVGFKFKKIPKFEQGSDGFYYVCVDREGGSNQPNATYQVLTTTKFLQAQTPLLSLDNLAESFERKSSCRKNEIFSKFSSGETLVTLAECKSVEICDRFLTNLVQSKEGIENAVNDNCDQLNCPIKINVASGVIQCSSEPAKIFEYFFTGLDKKLYGMSDSFPEPALIQFDKIITKNNLTTFQCDISTFLLQPLIQFEIKFLNETRHHLVNTSSKLEKLAVTQNDRFGFARRIIEIPLEESKKIQEIKCRSPWRNSSQWIGAIYDINPKDEVIKVTALPPPMEPPKKVMTSQSSLATDLAIVFSIILAILILLLIFMERRYRLKKKEYFQKAQTRWQNFFAISATAPLDEPNVEYTRVDAFTNEQIDSAPPPPTIQTTFRSTAICDVCEDHDLDLQSQEMSQLLEQLEIVTREILNECE